MYIALLALLVILAAWLAYRGVSRGRPALLAVGVAVLVLTAAFFGAMSFTAELLWFEALGHEGRFWRMLGWQVASAVGGALVGAALLAVLTLPLRQPATRLWPEVAGALVGGVVGAVSWDEVALALHRVETGITEPILGLDAAFYLFTLPLLDVLFELGLWLVVVGLIALAAERLTEPELRGHPLRGLLPLTLVAGLVAGLGHLRGVFRLLTSDWGVVAGPGWTDVHVRLPVLIALVVVVPLMAALPLIPGPRRWLARVWARFAEPLWGSVTASATASAWAGIALLWALALLAAPGLVQWLVVQPSELTFELPYIRHNIELTRTAFGLGAVEDRRFPADERFTPEDAVDNADVLREVRLWDWRALDDVYAQFQEFRLYYEFLDVDVDRYRFGDRYRQVMVSPREMAQQNLPAQSQTFVNQVFKYTHGYGITLAPVHDFTREGLPWLLVRDIPPVAAYPELEVEVPQIYYGELGGPVVANSATPEFDYPQGDENAYVRYDGHGGVELDGLWRRLVFGWTHFGTRFLLSGYPRPESRVMYHRTIRDRVGRLAPFLRLDHDPYVALVDGRLVWIQDAYTVSSRFPYSEPYDPSETIEMSDGTAVARLSTTTVGWLGGVNYVRNSVKVVVDAYDGDVTLYVFEPDDPLIGAWRKVFPELFVDGDEMPPALRDHVRYPSDYLLVQGRVFAKYHMADPVVFYNQEDLWVRATEQHYGQVQPVDPYYVMWQLPGASSPEFALILPFTPKNRQVAIGWIAGLCDGDNYGRFLAYQFPKDQRVLGPQQVETKIDQDPTLSAQLSLWDQRGSRVLRGNVLAIPLGDSLLYVEPIYLRAETAAYPELRLVVLMVGDDMAFASTFEEALAQLVGARPEEREERARELGEEIAPVGVRELAGEADRLFREYLRLQGAGELEAAGRVLQQLSDVLERLSAQPGEG